MAHWRTRKDGTRYRVEETIPKGMSSETFAELQIQDAKRSTNARRIDNKIKAPIDLDGQHWKLAPNRYDVRGIDDPSTPKRKKQRVAT
jgi:hypothetical protein